MILKNIIGVNQIFSRPDKYCVLITIFYLPQRASVPPRFRQWGQLDIWANIEMKKGVCQAMA